MTTDLPLEEALELFSDLNTDDLKASGVDCSGEKLPWLVPMPVGKEERAQPPAKPKKKRIRRQKLELEYLRQLVGKLEEEKTQLKAQQRTPDSQVAAIKTEAQAPSLWKGIAERQRKGRAQAEEKNQRLRVSLEGQLKLAAKLERMLRKRRREEEVAEVIGCKRYKPVLDSTVRPTDDEIFADQLAHLERAHLVVGELFGGPEFADRTALFCDLHVMEDPNSDTGVAFVTKASSMLPFDLHVTEKAFWRTFAEDGPKKKSYFHDERIVTENLVARSYGLNFDAGSFHTNVRGKQTYRKYVGDDYVIIMWKSRTEPVEINSTKFSGLRCTQTAWIVLRGVNLVSSDAQAGSSVMVSTSLQSYSKMTLDLEEDIADQELQVGALTDFVVNSHDVITDVCGKMINEVLVEEDWNINGWLNNIVL